MSEISKVEYYKERIKTVQEMIQIGKRLGLHLTGGEVLALTGELGTGKTILTRGIALGLGIPMDQVSSPTFSFIQEYTGSIPLIHVDLYRLEKLSDIFTLGLEEYFNPGTIVVIEWAERFPQILPSDYLSICLDHGETETIRLLSIKGTGTRSIQILANFLQG